MMESSRMSTSTLMSSSLLSTSNSLLSSSLSSGLLDNKLLKPSTTFKRQISDSAEESTVKKTISDLSSNRLQFESLSLSNSLSSSILKTSSSLKGISTSSVLASKSAGIETESRADSGKSFVLSSSLLQKEESKNVENFQISSFPAYPGLVVDEETLKSKTQRFHSDTEHRSNLLPLQAKKEKLLQFVCVASGGLVPQLKKADSPTRLQLDEMIAQIAEQDPEFILKLALYCRKELNLRLISNLLTAIASRTQGTSFYLKKYFSATVQLPSDWTMVANLFLTVNQTLPTGSLPAALRRVMKEKFRDFDEHQLAKYNKSLKGPSMEGIETEEERDEVMRGRDYDLKRLVRLLHISDPPDFVLAILEKKYPEDKEKFRQSRLEGMFDPSRAGKRMKLKTPITWETQISLKGNKPEVWESLIEEKKLPYMATVRNIRNLLMSGISEAHIQRVCNYISNETAVGRSKMFPFQFFTAYDVLNEMKRIKEEGRPARNKGEGKEKKENWMIAKEKKRNEMIKGINLKHIESIKKSLDNAVNISARKNIPPLKGTTLILCGYGNGLNRRFTEAKGISENGATVRDTTALFSLMCEQACEDSHLVFFSRNHLELKLPGRDILSNVEFVKTHTELNKKVGVLNLSDGAKAVIRDYLEEEKHVDNIIVFQDDEDNYTEIYDLVKLYRKYINKDLLLAMVNICGRPSDSSELDDLFSHQNDLNIRGFSDSVFNLIVKKGNGGQLEAVEDIDRKYNLINLQSPLTESQRENEELSPGLDIPVWQQVRVFISSTFLDMEAERNILHQFVLPQLQRRAAHRFITVDFIDLRWGLSSNQIRSKNEVELCLDQIKRSDLFIGILGSRYGWVPDRHIMEDISEYRDWVRKQGHGCSITELEMRYGVLDSSQSVRDRSFFYFRSPEVSAELSQSWGWEEKEEDWEKLLELKDKIRASGAEVMDGYYGTVQDGKVRNLEEFGTRVLNNLCNALDNLYPSISITEASRYEEELKQQKALCNKIAGDFVGRSEVVDNIRQEVGSRKTGVVSLTGSPGSGITSILATVASLTNTNSLVTIPFICHSEEQPKIQYVLKYIIHHLGGKITEENSIQSLSVLLQQRLDQFSITNRRVVIFLDSLEKGAEGDVCWFPENIPENCLFVVKSLQGSKLNALLKKQKDLKDIPVKPLNIKERNEICRSVLSRRGKSLEESAFNNQLLSLVGKTGAGSPGYLLLAIDQISKEANFVNLNKKISGLGSTMTEIYNDILDDCEQVFGSDFVKLVIVFLAQSFDGLTKSQITTVCSFYHHLLDKTYNKNNVEKVMEDLEGFRTSNTNFVSYMDVSMCVERLEPCLRNNKDVLKILETISPVIQNRYIKTMKSSSLMEINAILAAIHLENYNKDVIHPSGILSLSHHLAVCGDIKLLKKTLCTPRFIQLMSSLGLGSQLYRQYLGKSLKFKSAQEKFIKDPLVKDYQAFVKNHLETIKYKPYLIPQVILNEPQDSVLKNSVSCDNSEITTLRWDNGPKSVRDTELLGQIVISNTSNPTTCILPLERTLVTGYTDGSILLSNRESLEEEFCLVGHSESITGLGELDREVLISSSSDGLLSSWDLERRVRLNSARAHERRLTCLAVRHPHILTASWDCTVKVWSRSLVNLSTIHTRSPINSLLLHPTRQAAITGGWDSTIRVWDLETLKQKAVLRGHDSSVQSLRLSEDNRKIISGSLNGTVKVWDSRTGTEVASYSTRQGLSHLSLAGDRMVLGHTDGVITEWPLALGRTLLTVTSKDMLCPMYRQFRAGEVSMVDPTSLTRELTAMHEVSQAFIMIGFGNGDIQLNETQEDQWRGWKVFESKIDLIGSESGWDLQIEESEDDEESDDGIDESSDSDESDCSDSDESDFDNTSNFWDDDLNLTLPSSSILDWSSPEISPVRRRPGRAKDDVFTVWAVSGVQVVLATFHGPNLMATISLTDIRSNVVDLKVINKEIVLVFTKSGIVYIYNSSERGSKDSLRPVKVWDTLHGVLTAITISDTELLVTVGSDGKARFWSYLISEDGTFRASLHSESTPFTSNPVGVALTKQRQKDILLLGFEDGTQALVEMKDNFQNYGKPLLVEGNGHGMRDMVVRDDRVLLTHSDGVVSLWSDSGSEISQYNRGSTAALISLTQDNKLVLMLGRTDITAISPTEAECEAKHSGHQGPLTALASSPQALYSAGRDGKVRRWKGGGSHAGGGGGGGVTDTIVSVLADPEILSLSKSGQLCLWAREGERVEPRDRIQLEGGRYRMMTVIRHNGDSLLLTTLSAQGKVKVWDLIITPATFQTNLRAELDLGMTILRVDTVTDASGKILIVAAMENMAYVLHFLQVQQTGRCRIVTKETIQLTTAEHEMLFDAVEYLNLIDRVGPLKLFRRKFILRGDSVWSLTYLNTEEDGSVEVCTKGKEGEVRYQMHDQELTDIKMTSKHQLVTVSLDGKVKVWCREENSLYQTGEFTGLGPGLTSLDIDQEDNMVVGDMAGNVFCLRILQGTIQH